MRTATRRKNTKVTKKELDLVHTLRDAGLKHEEICRIANVGMGTVHYLAKSETIADYKRISSVERVAKTKAKAPAVNGGKTTDATTPIVDKPVRDYKSPVFNTTDIEIGKKLDRIATALESLVEAWETKPNKRRFM